jgi:vacuolar protein sorting-associated protein 13A/C
VSQRDSVYRIGLIIAQHPFAAGLTLAAFTVVSVNDQWQPAFIESTAGSIHKVWCPLVYDP